MTEPTTIEELESWHARRAGWMFGSTEYRTHDHWHRDQWPSMDDEGYDCHPIAPTIDAAVRAFPKGWQWERYSTTIVAWSLKHSHTPDVTVTGHTTDDIRRDLLALARLAHIAEGAEQ